MRQSRGVFPGDDSDYLGASPASPMFNFETLSSGALRKPSGAHKPRAAMGWRAPAPHPGATDRRSCVRLQSGRGAQCPETSMPPAASSPPSARRGSARSRPHGREALPAAIAAHSSSRVVARSAAPAVTMSPMVARIRQLIPAQAAMNTHFSHISCRIISLRRDSKRAPANADRNGLGPRAA